MRFFVILASAVFAAAQGAPPKLGSVGGSTGGVSTGSSGTIPTGSIPSVNRPSTTNSTNSTVNGRGPFFFGKVSMPDGTPPPSGVIIERVCGSVIRPQAYTDSHGEFAFQVGETQDMMPDATESAPTGRGIGSSSNNQSVQGKTSNLSNCDLRASMAGYRSDTFSLAGRRSLDDPNIGTLILHPYAKPEGLTTSATSLLAPKDAHKAFEKGLEAMRKSKLDEAESDFLKATEIYPRYASAWMDLGSIYEQRKKLPEARDAYAKAVAADSKFIKPYERLYILAFADNNWNDLAQLTDKVMRLNPYDFPQAVYFNAVANSQLGKLDLAEKSAREALVMGSASRNPKVYYILGVILTKKQDFKGAAEYLQTYLKSDAVTDRDAVKKLLADVEKQVQARADVKPQP
jgi:tetratricopeptide (TPR) repeat protein